MPRAASRLLIVLKFGEICSLDARRNVESAETIDMLLLLRTPPHSKPTRHKHNETASSTQ
jgi:hypothetical protein